MATPAKDEENWFQAAVELVVRHGLTFRQAVSDLGIGINSQEAETFFRRKAFQKLLRAERHRYMTELANDPGATKTSAIGNLLQCASGLMEAHQYDKAAEVYLKIAKLQGWVGAENNVNVFNGLTQSDYVKLRAKLEAKPAEC
jgi:hypothetical protein